MSKLSLIVVLLVLAIVSLPLRALAETSELWGKDGEKWSPTSRLPDYSYAGYHCGEKPIPDVPAATDATKFGAAPNDDADDAPAIQKAIDATTSGAVTLPAGRFVLMSEVVIEKPNVVLRGAGRGKTILFAPKSLETLHGEKVTDGTKSSYSFTGGFVTLRGADKGVKLADVSSAAKKGDRVLVVDQRRAADVKVGAWVRLSMNNADALGRLLHGGLEPGPLTVTSRNSYVTWVARVTAVDGRRLTIDRPLRCDVRTEWEPQLFTYAPTVQEVGVESLTFDFPGVPKRPHLQEEGFNAIFINGVANAWVRDVEVIDADNGLNVNNSRFCTFTNLSFTAPKRAKAQAAAAATRPVARHTGHHAMWVRGTQDCLFSDFRLETEYDHDLTVEGLCTGTVFMRGKGVALNFDHHRNIPWDNLFTDLDAGNARRLWQSSGMKERGPHSGIGETFWNVRWTQGGPPPAPPFPRANAVGMKGMAEQTGASGDVWVEPVDPIEPPNLYEAQLRKRLGGK